MNLNLDLDDPERVVEAVPGNGITWETTGRASDVTMWLGNATEADRQAIRLAAKQAIVKGNVLRITFPSVTTFLLGYDAHSNQFLLYVP